MKNDYKDTKTTISLINNHFVFCPRYRRKIFHIQGVESLFKELTIAECDKQEITLLAMECHIDHVHIFVSVLLTMDIPTIMRQGFVPRSKSLAIMKKQPLTKARAIDILVI